MQAVARLAVENREVMHSHRAAAGEISVSGRWCAHDRTARITHEARRPGCVAGRSPGHQIGPCSPLPWSASLACGVWPLATAVPGSSRGTFRAAYQFADSESRGRLGRPRRGARRTYRCSLAGVSRIRPERRSWPDLFAAASWTHDAGGPTALPACRALLAEPDVAGHPSSAAAAADADRSFAGRRGHLDGDRSRRAGCACRRSSATPGTCY